jgi:protein O-mannosyl-transferase
VKKKSYYIAVVVALLTFTVYLPSVRNGFVNFDDDKYVLGNIHINSLDWTFFKWAFTDISLGLWHPLTWISYAVDYSIWGTDPLGFHLIAIVLHTINTFLVVYLVIRLLENTCEISLRYDGIYHHLPQFLNIRVILITAGVTGLLFGLHPIHVESVAWISERKDLLCALFYLLCIIAYTFYDWSLSKKSNLVKNPSILSSLTDKWYLLSIVFFALALASKTMAVSIPVVLLLLDWFPYRRLQSIKTFTVAVIEKTPFIVLSLLISVVSIVAQRTSRAMATLAGTPLSSRIFVATKALVAYLWAMILPLNLTPFYPYPKDVHLLSIEFIFCVSLIIAITSVCLFLVKKHPIWITLWSYYVITLLPVIGIVQVGGQARADRYTYLPSLAPFLLFGLMMAWVFTKMQHSRMPKISSRLALIAAASFLIVPLIYLTLIQTRIWDNSLTLWNYTVEKQPLAVIPHYDLGYELLERRRFDEAIEEFKKITLQLDPNHENAHYNLGRALEEIGRTKEAITEYQKVLQMDPTDPEAHYNLAICFSIIGKSEEAVEQYRMFDKTSTSKKETDAKFIMEIEKKGLHYQAAEILKKIMSVAKAKTSTH